MEDITLGTQRKLQASIDPMALLFYYRDSGESL
jgi:hypothetical protein